MIFLIGYMGSGKTTVGKQLANCLAIPHFDTDKLISKETNKSIPQLFEDIGELSFRELETKLIQDLPKSKAVISTGGGLPCYNDNIELIQKKGISIYINLPVKTLCQRLEQGKSTRPLIANLNENELEEFISKQLAEREKYYKKAHIEYFPLKENINDLVRKIELL